MGFVLSASTASIANLCTHVPRRDYRLMVKRVAMFEGARERLSTRLAAVEPSMELWCFDDTGRFSHGGQSVSAEKMELDYLWLGPDLAGGKYGSLPFDVALGCKRIEVVQTFNAGLDHPAYKQLAERDVRICNSSAQSVAISEYVMAHALHAIAPIEERRTLQQQREWKRTPFREIAGMHWIIVGYGPIGRETAKRAKAFGASITVVRRSGTRDENVDRVATLAQLPALLPEADVIVLACPLNDETRALANARFFDNTRQNAILINIARGGLIEEAALLQALDSGRLGQAVLDVFEPEPLPEASALWTHPRILVTAHTSFDGDGTRGRWDELFFDNLPRFLRDEVLVNEVNPTDLL